MLPDELLGDWTPKRLLDLFGSRSGDDIDKKHAAQNAICELLNRLNNLPATRIAEIKLILGVAIRFGDNSAIELKAAEGTKFLNEYIIDRDSMIAIMEYNREGDPRKTGEFDRLQRIETRADQARQIFLGWKDRIRVDVGRGEEVVSYSNADFERAMKNLEDRS